MTRQEFIDIVDDIWALQEFCSDIGYCLEGIYDEDERDDYLDGELTDYARDMTWQELLNFLDNMPTGCDYYYLDDWGEWTGYDAYEITDLKQEVLEWADENDMFDSEDDDEEDIDNVENEASDDTEGDDMEDDEPVEFGCDMVDFLQSGNETIQAIQARDKAEKAEIERAMKNFLMAREA